MQTSTDANIEMLLTDLSDAQREAVTHTDGPLLILAGPGSGKTRVVTRRAAHLACTVTDPHRILAITFTNKAAKEMQARVDVLGVANGMTVCTFHALCAKLLRWHHDRAGVPKNFTIFDRDDRRKLIKKTLVRCNLASENWSPASVEQEIGRAKNAMLTPEAYAQNYGDYQSRTYARIYETYEKLLTEMGGLDFDDLLMRMAMTLDRDGELRTELENRFHYVLIDEYQDTNAAQYKIARLLTRDRKNLCATGDPDQSIYGWRGADIENILSFEKDYPSASVVRLEQNYRSTKRILAAADSLITGNTQRKEKALWTENDEGVPVRVIAFESGEAEAFGVAQDIARQTRGGASLRQVAIFYRVNSLSRVIEEALMREGINYQIARGVEFYNRKEIRDVLAYIRVLLNPADEIALLRVINTPPRGIGATTIGRLTAAAQTAGMRVIDALMNEEILSGLGRSAAKVRVFGKLLSNLTAALELSPPKALEFVISHSGLRAMYKDEGDGDDAPRGNLDELVSAAAAYHEDNPEATLIEWLEYAALVSDVDAVAEDVDKVTLMTLHAAKGLEFDIVYVLGLEDGLLPFRRDFGGLGSEDDTEEERRLCFVGMTRARKGLTLTRARYRMMRGITQRTVRSPFLDELPEDGVECSEQGGDSGARRAGRRQPVDHGELPADVAEWTVGTLVEHPLHGLGQILSIHRGARRTHVDVQFKDGEKRSWVLEFADLKRVDFDDVGDAF